MALPGWGSRKGAEFELSTGVGPDFTPELFLEKDVADVIPPVEGNDAGPRVVLKLYEMGSWVQEQRLIILWEAVILCQKIHKNGIGCGLAKDEGSKCDQEDSVTDHRPPAGWLDFLHLREFGLNEAQPWEDKDEAGGQASND